MLDMRQLQPHMLIDLLLFFLVGCGGNSDSQATTTNNNNGQNGTGGGDTFEVLSFDGRVDAFPGSADENKIGLIASTLYTTDQVVVSAKFRFQTSATLTYSDLPVRFRLNGQDFSTPITPVAWSTLGTSPETYTFTLPWHSLGTLSAGSYTLHYTITTPIKNITTGAGNTYLKFLQFTISAPSVGPG